MTLPRTGKLEDIREAFADLVGQWISEGTERRVTMEAAKDECGLLAVKLVARGDTVSISWDIENEKQADLLAEIEAAYRHKLDGLHAAEFERLKAENRELRAKITQWADEFDSALTKMETTWTEMGRPPRPTATPS